MKRPEAFSPFALRYLVTAEVTLQSHPSEKTHHAFTHWQQHFDVDGLRLEVCADDDRVAAGVYAFTRSHWVEPGLTSEPAVVAIHFQFNHRLPTLPVGGARLTLAHGVAHVADQTIYIAIADAALVIEPDAPLRICLADADDAALIGILFTHALHAALRRAQRYELHCAALTAPVDGAGVLFIGDSGSGKSTLTMRLAAQGWRYLTDDSVLLRDKADGLRVVPLRRKFGLTPQTLQACGVAETGLPSSDDKRFIEPANLFPARHAVQLAPRHLVFPTLTHAAKSRLAPLTQAAAMMRLLRQSPWACFDPLTGRAHLQCLTQLAQSARSWELQAGRDLLEVPEAAAVLLGELNHA
ncbi:MAG: hypothetical protein HOP19_14105 [Acidobacteria bacterium]|nr:hypothetical protein [Acidobacteriota bacterium]